MPPRIFTRQELQHLAGQTIGTSDWLTVTQQRIDDFAQATGDRQWIHCDPDRAQRDSPYGATIAHGFLTLSLCAMFCEQLVRIDAARSVINYGLNRVRFPSPVRAGANIRLVLTLNSVTDITHDSQEIRYACVVEIQGEAKPACAADWVLRILY